MGLIIDVGGDTGTANLIETVPTFADLPSAATAGVGAVRVTEDTGVLYVSDGTTWNAAAGGGAVISVNGQTGTVVLDTDDITEGVTNLYFTNARVLAAATSAATANTVVRRDGSANFAAGTITASLNGNALNVTGVVAIANGGTGQSNQQAGLNNLTDIGSHTDGDVLQLLGGNAQFAAAPAPTLAQVSAAIGAPANSFIFSDATSQIVGYGNWHIDPATFFSNVDNFLHPSGLGGNTNTYSWNINVAPSANSPTDSMILHFFGVGLDTSATGFSFGTAGQAAVLLGGGYNYGGNGASFGTLRGVNFFNSFGNGTDPGTFQGVNASAHAYNVSANITLDGAFNAYDFNLNIDAAAITTSNFNVLYMSDFSQMPVDVYGYQMFACQPNIATIKNNHNFNGPFVNPTIGTMEGNAQFIGLGLFPIITTSGTGGVIGVNFNPSLTTQASNSSFNGVYIGGNITTMGAAGASYQGINVNPTVTTSHGNIQLYQANPHTIGGDADITCYQANMNQVTTSGNTSVMNLSGTTATGGQSQFSADGVHMNIGGTLIPLSAQTIQSQHVIFTSYNQTGVGAITGTDVLCNIMSPDIDFGTITDSIAIGPSGLGVNMVAFAGQCHNSGSMDLLSALLPTAIFANDFTLGDWRNINATLINAGYTGVCGEATAFYHAVVGAGLFATTHWGLRVVTPGIENYVESMAVGTSTQKVTNASVAIELGGVTRAFVNLNVTTTEKNALTALPGMQVFDTTLSKLSYYDGTVWVNL